MAFIQDLVYTGLESFGKYYSIYLAKVYENQDPDRMGRLKLIIPEVAGQFPIDVWAYPSNMYAGVGYGIQLIPQKGDIVWVEFERGNVEKPIWRHGYPGLDEAPPADKYKPIENLWLVTPNGTSVLIDQVNTKIEVYLPKEKSGIEIAEKGISIINPSMISLGKLDKSDYSAVKGEILLEGLKDLREGLDLLTKALQADILTSAGSPFLRYPKMAIDVPKTLLKLLSAKDKLNKILSKNTTLQ